MYNNFSSKKTKKVISALLASALVVTSAPITASAATKKVVGVGKTVTYKAGATVKKITVKNKKVVKATKSKKNKKYVTLKGLKAGKTTVTIKTSKKTIKLNVCVGATKITKKTLKTTMTAGGKQTVSVTAAGGKGDTITFTSSKKSVLKVNKASAKASAKGIAKMSVAAVAEGTAKLTVASKNTGVKKAFTIKVVAATPAPATQPPTVATTPAVTGTATAVATTPAVQATATAAVPGATDATATPGTDVTATPGTDVTATPGADVTATPGTDVTQNPDATVAPTFDPVTAKEGTLTVTTNVSGASIKVISGGATVASVAMNPLEKSITTPTLNPGVYEVEVSKKGYDTYKTTITVDGNVSINANLAEAVVLGASATVTNSLIEYENTVLVNDNAIVTVTVKDKNGNLVPNKTVVFSANKLQGSNLDPNVDVEVKGQNVQSTDANGRASFVVGLKTTTTDSTNTASVVSAEFSAKVLDVTDGTNSAISGCVGFAALDLASVGVDEATRKSKNLAVGENAKKVGYTDEYTGSKTDRHDGIAQTYSLKQASPAPTTDVHYISTQKVSTEGTDEREVTFDVNPKIVLPMMSTQDTEMRDFVQPVNEKSGDYFTYADKEYDKIIVLKEDTSKLQYATLMFNDIKISKYTKLVIESYKDEACTASEKIASATVEIKGEHSQKDFGYQIPLNVAAVKAIKVSLKSAGQVQTDMNSGYDIREIVGIYNSSSNSTAGGTKDITTAKVAWETVNPTMSNFATLDTSIATAAAGLNITPKATGNTFDYQVPVFPYTGDAVIREFDSNKKIVAYYLVPTIKGTSTAANNNNMNTNIIAPGKKAYEATETEAINHQVGTIKADGNNVSVNSSEVGSTNLKGTITLPSLGGDVLDASNKNVYTSVQWNPLPKDAEVSTSDAFLALAGQNVTVYAQLSDKNGNPVSLANQTITYTVNDTNEDATTTFASNTGIKTLNGTAVVKNTNTDVNGRATLTLNNAQAAVIDDLKATAGNYDVILYIGDGKATTADIYWVNADLAFKKSVEDADYQRTDNDTKEIDTDKPVVSTPWQYAVKTVGNVFVTTADKTGKVDADGKKVYEAPYYKGFKDPGTLEGFDISIDGLKINTTFDEDNRGTYKVAGNGVVDASSDREYSDTIINELNETSVGANVTFTAKKGDITKTYKCVGEGNANMTAKMKLNVSWEAQGSMLSMTSPAGTTISRNLNDGQTGLEGEAGTGFFGHADLYVKVTDATGKNPKEDTVVKFKSGTASDEFSDGQGAGASTTTTATTDGNGVAHVVLNVASKTQPSSVITASVDGVDKVATTTINWVKYEKEFGLANASLSSEDAKQIVLTFNNKVEASSVKKDMFEVKNNGDSNPANNPNYGKKYEITDATANGRYVYLTLKNALPTDIYKVSITPTTEDSVKYTLSDEKGVGLTRTALDFYSDKIGSFKAKTSYSSDVATITLDNIRTGIDTATATADVAEEEFAKRFVITVDGKVQDILTADASSNSMVGGKLTVSAGAKSLSDVVAGESVLVTGTVAATGDKTMETSSFTIQLKQTNADQKVAIYYLGGSETYTVKAADDLEYENYVFGSGTIEFEFSRNIDFNTVNSVQYTVTTAKDLIKVNGKKLSATDIVGGGETAPVVSISSNKFIITLNDLALTANSVIEIDKDLLVEASGNSLGYTNDAIKLNGLDKTAPTVHSSTVKVPKAGDTISQSATYKFKFSEALDSTSQSGLSSKVTSALTTSSTSTLTAAWNDAGDELTITFTYGDTNLTVAALDSAPIAVKDIHGNSRSIALSDLQVQP